MPIATGTPEPEDNKRRAYDFSRVGGFRLSDLTDLQKAQLLHRVGDWAQEALHEGCTKHGGDPLWNSAFIPQLEALMKAATQIAIYIDNERLGWQRD